MPLFFQLQVWFCCGPIIAALLLIPSVVGLRPAIASGSPTIYLCDSAAPELCSNLSESTVSCIRRSEAASQYRCAPAQQVVSEEHLAVVDSNSANPATPRAP
jgi:hypothetical protein